MSEEREQQGTPKRSVEEAFKDPGHIEAVVGVENGFQALGMFDHPEELIVREMKTGGVLILRRSDVPELELREYIANEVMREMGIDPSNIGYLPMDTILGMRTEIRKRLDAHAIRKPQS